MDKRLTKVRDRMAGLGRQAWLRLVFVLGLAIVAFRIIVQVLPAPLIAEERRVRISLYVAAAPVGLAESINPGDRVWQARPPEIAFGNIVSAVSRAVTDDALLRLVWHPPVDLLLVVEAEARYRADQGLFIGRNLPVRVGDTLSCRTALARFQGRVERITLPDGR